MAQNIINTIVTATNDAFPFDELSQVIGLPALMELLKQQEGNPLITGPSVN